MSAPPDPRPGPRRRFGKRGLGFLVTAAVLAGLVLFALSRLHLSRVGNALVNASLGWVALAFVLMASSLLLRSVSWYRTLLAALPETHIPRAPVVRATMIGVMASAVFPGRIGEPSRVLVLTRRLEGRNRHLLPIVAGTVFSQTLINLLALAILATITFTSVPLLSGHVAGIVTAIAIPLALCALVLLGPRLLALAQRSRSARLVRAADTVARALRLARQGLVVFTRPRHGTAAVVSQLAAWALQWLACYMVLLSLHLESDGGLASAAAILLAVNVSAILPATPSNVGVFQAACLVVLAAYGVAAGTGLAYGIILQAVEVLTALALGIPALLGENLSWSDIRRARPVEESLEQGTLPSEARAPGEDSLPGAD
jgi:phosphatidyl-myo-inositol alpha-mannosyltransferase